MPSRLRPISYLFAALFAALALTGPARAAPIVIDFEVFGGIRGIQARSADAIDGPVTISALNAHYDVFIDMGLQSSGRTGVGIHNGGGGSTMRWSFSETLLALSFDVSGWIRANRGAPEATITSSASGLFTIPFGYTGTVDLTQQPGFDQVDWIELSMPSPAETCVFFSNGRSLNCSTIVFDRLVVDAVPPPPVPAPVSLPAAFPLALGGLGMLVLVRLRGRR